MPPTIHLDHISILALIDLHTMQKEVDNDPKLATIIQQLQTYSNTIPQFSLHHGILKYKGWLVISKAFSLLPTILRTYQDSVFGGHFGFLHTYERMIVGLN